MLHCELLLWTGDRVVFSLQSLSGTHTMNELLASDEFLNQLNLHLILVVGGDAFANTPGNTLIERYHVTAVGTNFVGHQLAKCGKKALNEIGTADSTDSSLHIRLRLTERNQTS